MACSLVDIEGMKGELWHFENMFHPPHLDPSSSMHHQSTHCSGWIISTPTWNGNKSLSLMIALYIACHTGIIRFSLILEWFPLSRLYSSIPYTSIPHHVWDLWGLPEPLDLLLQLPAGCTWPASCNQQKQALSRPKNIYAIAIRAQHPLDW